METINMDLLSDFDIHVKEKDDKILINSRMQDVPEICGRLFDENKLPFLGIIVDSQDNNWVIYYIFLSLGRKIITSSTIPSTHKTFKTISQYIHGADWFEREIEDLFGFVFEGHPKLGDFILHDDIWPEGAEPMRFDFDLNKMVPRYKDLRPKRIVQEKGSFIMPIGPIFSGVEESVHFQIETIGEEIIKCHPRLFYKYRAIEKKAENHPPDMVLFLSERISGKSAFSHSLAFCMAIEDISGAKIPMRAQYLRMYLAELERIRHHIGVIGGICSSTGLVVAANQVEILEERMLRTSQILTGHRYLFGVNQIGGLTIDIKNELLIEKNKEIEDILHELKDIKKMLIATSSFLDRLEEVGVLDIDHVKDYAMVGPVARGSGYLNDIRKYVPYLGYKDMNFKVVKEKEGDGYARLRVFFSEIDESYNIIKQLSENLPKGEVKTDIKIIDGVGIGCVEGPNGACIHYVRINKGVVERYRVIAPSFFNWHGFHLGVEGFAFQDFPIILATFGLSVAENDR